MKTTHRVIIEDQFAGHCIHGHLGQFLTYLAGIENAKNGRLDFRDDPGR